MHSALDCIEHGTLINVSHFARFAKAESLEEIMNERGRPRKRGQLVRMLRRDPKILYGYDQARSLGEKHAVAIQEAAKYVRETDSGLRISETEVKRVLASWRPRGDPLGLVVVKPHPSESTLTLPNGMVFRIGLTAAVGPRPVYPRVNAAQKPSSHHNT